MSGFMRPFLSFTCMTKFFRILFSSKISCVAGILVVGVVTSVILREDSVQPLHNSFRSNEVVSQPLLNGVQYTQILSIPHNLESEDFLIALFFGCPEADCSGAATVNLQQGDHRQELTSPGLFPAPFEGYRFPFSGFSAGPATLEVKGISQNGDNPPGLLYLTDGNEKLLSGPGIQKNANAAIDWFKVVSGNEKLSLTFPNFMIKGMWLLSFMGFVGLAWRGARPEGSNNSINQD